MLFKADPKRSENKSLLQAYCRFREIYNNTKAKYPDIRDLVVANHNKLQKRRNKKLIDQNREIMRIFPYLEQIFSDYQQATKQVRILSRRAPVQQANFIIPIEFRRWHKPHPKFTEFKVLYQK